MTLMRMNKKTAFTLIETAIGIALISLVLAGYLHIYRVQFNKDNFTETRQRMNDIRSALADFQVKYNRLPCPAPLHTAPTATGFGREITDKCADGTIALGDTLRTGAPGTVRIGSVPVATLGLTTKHIGDKWDRRFLYAVSEKLADTTLTPYNDANGAITLKDKTGAIIGPLQNKTPFILLSFGKDGKGGVTTLGDNFSTCPGSGPMAENCNSDSTFSEADYSEVEDINSRFTHLLMNSIAYDPASICGSKGMTYGPTHPQRDAEGCVASVITPTTGSVALDVKGSLKIGDTAAACTNDKAGSLRFNATSKKMEMCDGNGTWQETPTCP